MKSFFAALGIRPTGIKRSNPLFIVFGRIFSLSLLRAAIIIMGFSLWGFFHFQSHDNTIFHKTRDTILYVLDPIYITINVPFKWVGDQFQMLSQYQTLSTKNANLQERLDALSSITVENNVLKRENIELKNIVDFKGPKNLNFITTYPNGLVANHYATLIKTQTPKHVHISKSSVVLGSKGLIGRIVDTNTHTTTIMAITDPNARTPVRSTRTNEHAILSGIGQNMMQIVHAEKDKESPYTGEDRNIKNGDVFVTSGLGDFYPHNIPVGYVSNTENGVITVKPFEIFSKILFLRISHEK